MATAQRRPAAPAKVAPAATPRAAPAAAKKTDGEGDGGAPTMPMTVNARTEKSDRVVSTTYDFGSTLDESVEKFGEAVVYGVFIDQATIRLQALLRRCITDEVADKEIEAKVEAWKMTVGGRERRSASEKVKDLLGKMPPEQKAELLKSLRTGK